MNARSYKRSHNKPWTYGYLEARTLFSLSTLDNPEQMAAFATKTQNFLPQGFGLRLDERCVEWPWALAKISKADTRILDAGSALNHKHILDQPLWKTKKLDIFTLAPENFCAWDQGISYLFGDIRKLPYRDAEFDLIISVSTLEHVGLDNVAFTQQQQHAENSPDDVRRAFSELRRVLKPSGRLLWSVPYGEYARDAQFQQFDAKLLDACAEHFAPAHRNDTFFLYTSNGWQAVAQKDCAYARYAHEAIRLEPTPDGAAAARAVACCEWTIQ